MSAETKEALAQFEATYTALLKAAEEVRACVERDSGLGVIAPADVTAIQRCVAKYFQLSRAKMLSRDKCVPIAMPRMIAMALCRQLTQHSLVALGHYFADRDHGTVLSAMRRIDGLVGTEMTFRAQFEHLRGLATEAMRAALAED